MVAHVTPQWDSDRQIMSPNYSGGQSPIVITHVTREWGSDYQINASS